MPARLPPSLWARVRLWHCPPMPGTSCGWTTRPCLSSIRSVRSRQNCFTRRGDLRDARPYAYVTKSKGAAEDVDQGGAFVRKELGILSSPCVLEPEQRMKGDNAIPPARGAAGVYSPDLSVTVSDPDVSSLPIKNS